MPTFGSVAIEIALELSEKSSSFNTYSNYGQHLTAAK